jgi:hypothetical protein
MDFIERFFGVSPDNGSGSLELIILLIPAAAIACYFVLRKKYGKQKA